MEPSQYTEGMSECPICRADTLESPVCDDCWQSPKIAECIDCGGPIHEGVMAFKPGLGYLYEATGDLWRNCDCADFEDMDTVWL